MRIKNRRSGFVLVHVLIMGVLMAMIASYVTDWGFSRYQTAARQQSYAINSARVESCYNQLAAASWDNLSKGALAATVSLTCTETNTAASLPTITLTATRAGAGALNSYRVVAPADVSIDTY